MKSFNMRYKHKSEWKYIVVQEENFRMILLLTDSGRLVAPLKKRKHRDLKRLMKEFGFNDQNQDESSGNDEIKNQQNDEKSHKLVFDENILEMNSINNFDDNDCDTYFTDAQNEDF